jgi:hypothetical protein
MEAKIRLDIDDYLTLYPYWKPIEIQKEFPRHSHCESQIRNYYKRVRHGTQHQALNALIKTTMNNRPENTSLADWKAKIASDIATEREKGRLTVWKTIEARERVLRSSE